MEKRLAGIVAVIFASFMIASCSSTNDNGSIDPAISDISGGSEGADVTVGDYGDNYKLSPEERAKLEALKRNNTIYFAYDKDVVAPEYANILQNHARFLIAHPEVNVIIQGHTDERGTPEYNIALGERRAKSVALYLQNLGVNVRQLSIVSYGEEKPAVLGTSAEAFAKNRRAVLVY